jgi:hypothetical protein
MRDAALLASKFFKELADVFDGQGKFSLPQKLLLWRHAQKIFS